MDEPIGLNFLVNPRKVAKPKVTKVNDQEAIRKKVDSLPRVTPHDRIVPDASLLLRERKSNNFFKLKRKVERGHEVEIEEEDKEERVIDPHLKLDDNWHIIQLLKSRMKLGAERYGHGLRVYDDTRKYGTSADSWEEMGLEEMLDGLVYLSAAMIRRDREKLYNVWRTNDDIIHDSYRKRLFDSHFRLRKKSLV